MNQGVSLEAFFSFKFKNSGLLYELGNNIWTGDLCWINGPLPPDLEVFRSALKLRLEENEWVKTDDGSRLMMGISGKTYVLQSVQVAFISWRMSGGIASEATSGIVAKRSTIGLRPLVSFGRPFATTLRSTVCASELLLFLHSSLLKLEARKHFQLKTTIKNGWTRLESPMHTTMQTCRII